VTGEVSAERQWRRTANSLGPLQHPTDRSLGAQRSQCPARHRDHAGIHPLLAHIAGGTNSSLTLPALVRCAIRRPDVGPAANKDDACPIEIGKSKGAMPAPSQRVWRGIGRPGCRLSDPLDFRSSSRAVAVLKLGQFPSSCSQARARPALPAPRRRTSDACCVALGFLSSVDRRCARLTLPLRGGELSSSPPLGAPHFSPPDAPSHPRHARPRAQRRA
jgi:hypothetical protein